jgi:flagellar hook-associated protein 1 FlgK
MSDFSALYVGLSGLEAQQTGLDTVGQNVSNADTPGYVDEQVELEAPGSVQQDFGILAAAAVPGNGVEVAGIERLANTFLQQRSYTEEADQGSLSAQQIGLQSIEDNFPEPSSSGISAQLTALWQAWSNLANNPSDEPTRLGVVEAASSLATSLNQTSAALSSLSAQTSQAMTSALQEVNQEASQVAALNQQILAPGPGTSSAASLEDQRDQTISQLSDQLGVTVSYSSDGTANVYSGTEALVSGPSSQTLSLSPSGPPYSLVWSQDGSNYQPASGSLAGMLEVVNNYIPKYQQSLDQVAQSLIGSVNYLMSTGYDLSGHQGQPFFLGTGASDIEVNPAVAADPSLIAAASAPVPSGSSATNEDGTVAAQVGELPNSETAAWLVPSGGWQAGSSQSSWQSGTTQTSGPEADFAYNALVTGLGQQTAAVKNALSNQQAVTTNVNSALQSATGVNTDEEMTKMVMYQNAYDANAKFISTLDSVLQSLLSMVHS